MNKNFNFNDEVKKFGGIIFLEAASKSRDSVTGEEEKIKAQNHN